MGPGPLPFAGGWCDQPAALMAAFEHCSAIEAKFRKLYGREGDSSGG